MKVASVLLSMFAGVTAARDPLDKPNIVMLFMDDMGYGDPGFKGHPTTSTPNIDRLAWGGKRLNTWYSGCPVCSGSRNALMTGRQYTRTGVPGVLGPVGNDGLNLNETTVAQQLKKAGYATGMMGKWHLGQRRLYLPGSRGFDEYLGIPYSDDMGQARFSPCSLSSGQSFHTPAADNEPYPGHRDYLADGYARHVDGVDKDPAGGWLPLVRQSGNGTEGSVSTKVLEQPLDLTTLGEKYADFVTGFIRDHAAGSFFLYVPFSHVHTTRMPQFQEQFAGCAFQNSTCRGHFGDALAEADDIVGQIVAEIEKNGVENNTLILFSSDNGPWMIKDQSAGSLGPLYARSAGYWNVGKGSQWEGGIREAAFAYWPGQIAPGSHTAETVSSLDLLPTVSALAGVPLPAATLDGKDASDVILDKNGGKSPHDFLWMYGGVSNPRTGPTAVRHKQYKAYWRTGPGLGGCTGCVVKDYPDPPLLFDVLVDPSEQFPLTQNNTKPSAELMPVVDALNAARAKEIATFTWGHMVPAPDEPGEGPGTYGVCCDRAKQCKCD